MMISEKYIKNEKIIQNAANNKSETHQKTVANQLKREQKKKNILKGTS